MRLSGGARMDLLGSPARTLISIIVFVLIVMVAGTLGYLGAGWSLSDAAYMVVLTIYTVGYGEVRPIDTGYLHAVTMGTMILGCTGMILFTGALVQFLTITQLQNIFGVRRVQREIDKLDGHVIVVGFGRIGQMLAQELKAGKFAFVVLESDEKRATEARDMGYLCLSGDATDEAQLLAAGLLRARTLATVLPDDAANVFITLSAKALNPAVEIIARGEAPATERKLLQAGAHRVVLPAHSGAERMAEMILYPETERFLHSSEGMEEMERSLRGLGLEMQVIVAPEKGAFTGLSVADIEARGKGSFFIVQVNKRNGPLTAPTPDTKVEDGDGVVIVGRGGQAVRAMFEAPPERVRTGRN